MEKNTTVMGNVTMANRDAKPSLTLQKMTLLLGLCAGPLLACSDNPVIPNTANRAPVADARIQVDGRAVDENVDGGAEALVIALDGDTVEVTLDGTKSTDPDGTITTYRWLSATPVQDGGVGSLSFIRPKDPASGDEDAGADIVIAGRAVPPFDLAEVPGARKGIADWPKDGEKSTVELTEGLWTFALWVIDDGGKTSEPDTIQITVGDAVNPAVAECAAEVIPLVSDACATCVCNISETCRTAVVETACNEDCWGLIQCIGVECPDFATLPQMDAIACVTGACGPFLGGAMAATAAGMCVTMCLDDCR